MSRPQFGLRALRYTVKSTTSITYSRLPLTSLRCLTTIQPAKQLSDAWFNGSFPAHILKVTGGSPRNPKDERTLKLGKTLTILQERLPTICQSQLPPEILSPQIQLRLFPTTHPNLFGASGRHAYIAALWTSPLAWGRIPIIGNVRLEILSERMIKSPRSSSSTTSGIMHIPNESRGEQLVVKWRTTGKTRTQGARHLIERATEFLGLSGGDEFTGLFIFEFDGEGRIISHTIENVDRGEQGDRGIGSKVVGLTDWLLGGIRGRGDSGTPCPALCAHVRSRQQ